MLEIAYESGGMDEEGNLVESEERRETEERLEAYENDIQDLQADVEDLQMLNEQMASTIGNVESIVAEMERFLADGEGKQVEDVVRGWKEFLNRMQELRLGPEERESEGSQERIFEERASEDTDSQPHPAHEPQHSDSHDQHHEPPQRPQFRRTSNTWRRNPKTIHPIISAIPTRTPMDPHLSAWVDPDFKKNVGVQTMPMRFGQQTDTQKLLSEVRPWGPPALCLPKKGIGLYLARPVLPPTILAATGGVEGSESVEGRMGGLSPVVSRGAALRS
ncbi:hypothetical protein HK097_010817 [Rhizophlyctis rosea]|uniref:Uncharacterized protein n=1 Tax=Rhizophlyctis rosea TaxID=64517 RepID=A0AAD5S8R4_9FUNG|nr:hypothetical protein HK097_010817 [Rhizophlyctis rosea]